MSDPIPSLPEGKQTMSSATVSPPLLSSYGRDAHIRRMEERLDAMAKSLDSSLPEGPADGVTQTGWPVPDGWKLVPIEPTVPMIRASVQRSNIPEGAKRHSTWGTNRWREILAAAPPPPQDKTHG